MVCHEISYIYRFILEDSRIANMAFHDGVIPILTKPKQMLRRLIPQSGFKIKTSYFVGISKAKTTYFLYCL